MENKMVTLSNNRQYILNPVIKESGEVSITVLELDDNGLLGSFLPNNTLRLRRPLREYNFDTEEEAKEFLSIFQDGADASLLPSSDEN